MTITGWLVCFLFAEEVKNGEMKKGHCTYAKSEPPPKDGGVVKNGLRR